MDFVEEIKSRVSTFDAARMYGFSPNKAGFICCPFHGEKSPSLKIYPGPNGWHCFGCGEGGDVIDFVSKLFDLEFKQSIVRINIDFFLRLPIDKKQTLRDKREAFIEERQRKKRIELLKKEEKELKDQYDQAIDEFARLYRQKMDFQPKSMDENLHPLFVESMQKMTFAEYNLERLERWLHEFRDKNRYTKLRGR